MLPILYSFRRCPYAIRARMTLRHCNINLELREVALSFKPDAMMAVSKKGTVPVLVLEDGTILDQSLEIMRWAICRTYPDINDNNNWLTTKNPELESELVQINDSSFKLALDGYKYSGPSDSQIVLGFRYRAQQFLDRLENQLLQNEFLLEDRLGFADIAIFPFIRQFEGVDQQWFSNSKYTNLRTWLNTLKQAELFLGVMKKHPIWQDDYYGS